MAARRPARQETITADEVLTGPDPAEREAAALAGQYVSTEGMLPELPEMADYSIPAELQARNDARITVHRMSSDSLKGEKTYCCEYGPGEFSLERLRLDKGGGRYWVRLIAPNPNNGGRPAIYWQAYPVIEGPPRLDAPVSTQAAVSPPVAVQADNTAVIMAGIKEMGTAIVTAMATAMAAQHTPQQSTREKLEEIKLLKEIFAPHDAAPPATPLSSLKDLLATVKELMPGGAEESPVNAMLGAAEKFLPLLGEILVAGNRGTQPAAAQHPSQPALAAPSATPNPTGANDMSIMLRMGINFLVSAAANGEPAEDYVNIVLNKVPEEDLAQLIENPNYMQFLTQHVPECANYAPWFAELVGHLKAAFAEDPPSEPDLTSGSQSGTTGQIPTGTAS